MSEDLRPSLRLGVLIALVLGVGWWVAARPVHGRLAAARAELSAAEAFCAEAGALFGGRGEDPRVLKARFEARASAYEGLWSGALSAEALMERIGAETTARGLAIERIEPGPLKAETPGPAGQVVSTRTFRVDVSGPWPGVMGLIDAIDATAAPLRVSGVRLVGTGTGVRCEMVVEQHTADGLFPPSKGPAGGKP